MNILKINNPFGSPVYYEEIVESTMDVSRILAENGEPHGTVIAADFQEKGRGRIRERKWQMEKNLSLPFTILLRFPCIEDIPPALTLRTGLAVSLAVEDFVPSLNGKIKIKWPNDILIEGKKLAGILCSADGGNVHIGIGINFAQKNFGEPLNLKATSISLSAGMDFKSDEKFILLEKILMSLNSELDRSDWKSRLEKRLYKKNESVVFIEGTADSKNQIRGDLCGIGENGELLIIPDGETEQRSFLTGELVVY
jgi:BirA family biotin operon repressor/biotin-[acetyl-CoA-carboxylase] ligase